MPVYRIATTKTLFFRSEIEAPSMKKALELFRWEHDFSDGYADTITFSSDQIVAIIEGEDGADGAQDPAAEPVDNSVDNFPESVA